MRRRTPDDEEINREISAHIELETEAFVAAGQSEHDARRAAHQLFGNTVLAKEDTRGVWGYPRIERMRDDLRFAVRLLRRYPAFSAAILIVLALGVGFTTAMFSVVNGVLLRPLPFREPSRLVMLEERWLPRFPRFEASPLDYLSWKEGCRSYSDIAAFRPTSFNLTDGDLPERIAGVRVTANLPAVLGVSPIIGRSFRDDEDAPGRNQVALIGDGLWRRRFSGDPGVIGRVVRMNGVPFTIVGVMPAAFRFPLDAEIWMPMGFTAADLQSRNNHVIWSVGRLGAGVTIAQAQAEMDTLMPQLHKDTWRGRVVSFDDHYVGDVRLALRVLFAASGCLLLIGCVNVASLLLARGAARAREMALRNSLGATHGRLVQQLLTEALFLSLLGGAIGLAIAQAAITLVRLSPWPGIYRLEETSLDPAAVMFAMVLSIATGGVFGLVPALRLARPDRHADLKAGGNRVAGSWHVTRIRRALVIAEVALAVLLLIGAGLFIRNLSRLLDVPLGFNPDRVLAVSISLPRAVYAEPSQQVRFADDLIERLQIMPDVDAVGISSTIPFTSGEDVGITFDGRSGEMAGTTANYFRVTPALLQVMEVPLVRGRLFTERDRAGTPPVVLINETMARRFFPNEDPIGKRLDIGGPSYLRDIVGVVGDIKHESLRTPTPPQVYAPFAQAPTSSVRLMLRVRSNPADLIDTVRHDVRAIDNAQPIADARTLDDVIARSLTRDRFPVFVLGAFASLALIVAALGLYSLVAYTVKQRANEIGIRMALGAAPRSIQRLVVAESLWLVFSGLGLGLVAALMLSGGLSGFLYEVKSGDPITFAAVAALQLIVGCAAAFIPARRAARVDPVLALRSE